MGNKCDLDLRGQESRSKSKCRTIMGDISHTVGYRELILTCAPR